MSFKSYISLELKYQTDTKGIKRDTRLFEEFLMDEQREVSNFLNEQFENWLNATQETEVTECVTLDIISLQFS